MYNMSLEGECKSFSVKQLSIIMHSNTKPENTGCKLLVYLQAGVANMKA